MLVLFATVSATDAAGETLPCGSPTGGETIQAQEALHVLRTSVGLSSACDGHSCTCDTNCSSSVTVIDALLVLRAAVGQAAELHCCCEACSGLSLAVRQGSELDLGWNGLANSVSLPSGVGFDVGILRRCADTGEPCAADSQCAGNVCAATCDCTEDRTCELTGPVGQKRCLTNLKECDTDADCVNQAPCVHVFGVPLPMSRDGNPVCIVSHFDGELTGTADTSTGATTIAARLRSRVFLGISIDQPCPRCGRLDQAPEIGDSFLCESGQFNGAPCTVEGISPDFGGVSRDCPPGLSGSISGPGLSIILDQLSTGTVTRTAQLPCASPSQQSHPSRGNGTCLDNDAACSSNADCMRCSGDPSIECDDEEDCAGLGTCAAAPDQPVSCGFWCHCGFCAGDPARPCFESSQCGGDVCQPGTAAAPETAQPQAQSNDCTGDNGICGLTAKDACPTTLLGTCSWAPFRSCSIESPCNPNDGECILQPLPCFESTISRTGRASGVGRHCLVGPPEACTSNAGCRRCLSSGEPCVDNADCDSFEDTCGATPCVADTMAVETASLFCASATRNVSINADYGVTGPAALRLHLLADICRCGDGTTGCGEQCDDGNATDGDGCDSRCRNE